ncbi:chemotaxis protein CheW [Salinarimonas soli]|uniref:CheW-like domain-containing protein n=1 Tax=Salinarimonas soli TaxID=1638099 RepID=A0A5B2VD70_9HYPH|nr:chemotaxis protein CheW [Salinarimonas soli]KAA2236279.1 hypothetical protein F0L46_16380 [Salinarimonas soli]
MPEALAVPGPQEAEADLRRFLTVRIEGDRYALPAGEVSEVVRVPPVARVPLAPASLLGLANLRGAVLPVVSLRRLLGRGGEGDDEAAMRAVVLGGASPVALVVDRVETLVSVAPDRIETRQAALGAREGERVQGAFGDGSGAEPTRILDPRGLIEAAFPRRERPPRASRAAAAPVAAEDGSGERPGLVTFQVAGQSFALPLAAVREIIPAPDSVVAVTRGDAPVLGVTSHRDTLLPLISLRGLLGLDRAAPADAAPKVIVTVVRGALVGLVADRMQAIVPADPALMEPIPPVLAARAGGETRIESIYRGGPDGGLVSVLAPERLFREDVMQRLGAGAEASGNEAGPAADAEGIRFVVFRLGEDEFGVPVEAVDEVARVPDRITRVPRTPPFLEGVTNLRGEVLPVIDGRRRFDMPPAASGERRRLLVVRSERHRAGIVVDAVLGITFAPGDAVEPAPEVAGETGLVRGVVKLGGDGRIVLLLEPAGLLTRAERGLLDAMAGEAEA